MPLQLRIPKLTSFCCANLFGLGTLNPFPCHVGQLLPNILIHCFLAELQKAFSLVAAELSFGAMHFLRPSNFLLLRVAPKKLGVNGTKLTEWNWVKMPRHPVSVRYVGTGRELI